MTATGLARPRSLRADMTALRDGSTTVATYLNEICDRIDDVEARVRAFVPEADRRLRLLAASPTTVTDVGGPWPDIPVAVKDIIRVDGFPTHAGSAVPPSELYGPQASVVSSLLATGALVLGKTETAEFAVTAPGPTGNPHNLAHTPGGSSSGSAAAVAAGMAPVALGTQTIASIVRPAAYCGVVGFKPSYGRIELDGVIPNSPSLDTIGWFTATVADAAIVSAAVCRDWRPDIRGDRSPVLAIPHANFLGRAGDAARRAFESQVARLRGAGFEVRDSELLVDFDTLADRLFTINRWELARTHEQWFARYEGRYRPETIAAIREGQQIAEGDYAAARRWQADFTMRLADTSAELEVDMWIAPAATRTAPRGLGSTGDSIMGAPFSMAGVPALSIPAGHDGNRLPWGIQCAGRAGQDERLLAHARAVETALAPVREIGL